MDRLWTPWRYDFVSGAARTDEGCVFCSILSDPARDEENFVLCRGSSTAVILNLYPYTVGHLLILAARHIAALADANRSELDEIIGWAQRCETALQAEYRPDGFNLGFNLGRMAGAGVENHLHMHVLPRWAGDANFLSVISETRTLPEALPKTYARLLPRFRAFAG
jgi:ATP adenylyltransferase